MDTCTSMQDSQLKLEQEKQTLELTIQELMRRLYGRRSERHADSPGQLALDSADDQPIEVLPDVTADEEFVAAYEEKRRRRRRRKPRTDASPHISNGGSSGSSRRCVTGAAGGLPDAGRRCGGDSGIERPRLWVHCLEYPKYKIPSQPELQIVQRRGK